MSALRHEEEAPRGFVLKSEHYRALAEIDALREELAYLREAINPPDALVDWVRAHLRCGRIAAVAMLRLWRSPPEALRRSSELHEHDSSERSVAVQLCHLNQRVTSEGQPRLTRGKAGVGGGASCSALRSA